MTPVPPFFNDPTGSPPPFPSLLTDRQSSSSSPLGLSEGACPSPSPPTDNDTTKPWTKTSRKKVNLATRSSPAPYAKKSVGGRRSQTRSCSRASTESASELSGLASESSESEGSSGTLSGDCRIPKPPGEPGRPGRGGYNLEAALDWNSRAFSKLKVSRTLIESAHFSYLT